MTELNPQTTRRLLWWLPPSMRSKANSSWAPNSALLQMKERKRATTRTRRRKQEEYLQPTRTEEGWSLEERAAEGRWEVQERSGKIHLPLVWTSHSMDSPQARWLPLRQTAQWRSKEEASEGQLHYLCCCRCNGSESPICCPHGINRRPGQMMVRNRMGVDVYNVSIHGWVDNAYRTPSCFSSSVHHAIPVPIPVLSCLPDRPHAPEDDVPRLHPWESVAVAAPREKNSYHPQAPPQEDEAKHAFANRINHQNKTQDLPCPNCSLHL